MTTDRGRAGATPLLLVGSLVGSLALAACRSGGQSVGAAGVASLPQGGDPVELDPADFTTEIDNPYWPMAVGDRWVYEETDEEGNLQRIEVTVLDETRTVASGIDARVVRDVAMENGQVIEETRDWYAQDADGNVWYLGEETAEYANGQVVSTDGSWEAGVDGAQPGVVLPADPEPGIGYRQEYLAEEAEDEAVVLSTSELVETPVGRFDGVLLTRDTNPLEPEVAELKFYARGVGPVLVVQTSGGSSRETLIETTRAAG